MSDAPSNQRGRNGPRPGSGFASSAGFAVAKGAALIGLAVVIGVILLQVVDDGSSGSVSTGDTESSDATTTSVASEDENSETTTTTTAEAEGPPLSPAELTVLVLNGGAPSGSAGAMSDQLRSVGYVTQLPASDDTEQRDGDVVMCNEGLEREAVTLALAVGSGVPAEPMRDPAPPGSEEADCVVIVGRPVT